MRRLVYDLMSGQSVIKSTTNYNEVVEWDVQEGHWNRIRFEEVKEKTSDKQKKKRKERVEKIAGVR